MKTDKNSNLFYVAAAIVLFFSFTSFTGWVSHIYDRNAATLSQR